LVSVRALHAVQNIDAMQAMLAMDCINHVSQMSLLGVPRLLPKSMVGHGERKAKLNQRPHIAKRVFN